MNSVYFYSLYDSSDYYVTNEVMLMYELLLSEDEWRSVVDDAVKSLKDTATYETTATYLCERYGFRVVECKRSAEVAYGCVLTID